MRQRRRDPLLTLAMLLFTLGLITLGVAFVLFAMGWRDLPLWLSLAGVLLPIGLALGVVRTRRQNPSAPRD
jgi:protein-S-isoprenylcysteine O-methyltransferase Ste14